MRSGGIFTWSEFRAIFKKGMTIAFIALFVMIGRMVVLSHHYFRDALEAEKAGRYEIALHAYNRAIRNYFPANPYVSRAIEGAKGVIERYHDEGKFTDEERALQDLRAALNSIRSFFQPCKNALREIDAKLLQFTEEENVQTNR